METGEKFYSVFAILFIIALISVLILFPEYRQLMVLLPITLVGLLVNVIFMFIVLRDIFLRSFSSSGQKILWVVLILVFWPAVLIYLPLFGFKARTKPPR
jgi:hypothetical protein